MSISRTTLGVLAASVTTFGALAGAAGAQAQPADAGAPIVSSISLNGSDLASNFSSPTFVPTSAQFYTNDPVGVDLKTPAADEFRATVTGLDPNASDVTLSVNLGGGGAQTVTGTLDNGVATFNLDPVPAGTNGLTVTETVDGQPTTQNVGYLLVDTPAEQLSLDQGRPGQGQPDEVNASDVSFSAQGIPNDPVELFIDGGQQMATATGDGDGNVWGMTPDTTLDTGYHTAYVESVDSQGKAGAPSDTVKFYVAPPAPTVISPAGAGTTDDSWAYANSSHPTFTVSGVDPGAKVTLLEGTDAGDPVAVGSVTSEAGGTVSVTATTQVEDGFHMFTVAQSETEGTGADQRSVASDWMADQTSVNVDTAAPTLNAEGIYSALTNNSKPTFTTDLGVGNINSKVQLINAVTGQTIGQYPLSDYRWTPSSPLPDGRYSVYAVTIDDTGNVGTARSAPVDFTLSTVAPAAPKVSSPADGATISAGDLTITTGGNAAGDYICPVLDAGTSSEDVSLCGQPADANGNATFTLSGGLSAGSHTLTVWASDQYGNYSQTVTTFTVRAATSSPSPPTSPTPKPKAPTVTTPVLPGGGLTVRPGGHTQLNLQVSAPGTVTVIIERHQGGKWVPSGTQTLPVKHAGRVPLAIGTSFAGHQLAPGSYRLAIQASSNGQRSPVLKVALTVAPPANRPHGHSRLLSLAVNPHSITWRRGLRAPKLWLTFLSSRNATLAMTLQARVDGRWQQVSDTSAHVLAGSDRLQLIGRWHGQMVPPRNVRLTVRATAAGMTAVTRTFSITVRHGQPVVVR